MSIKENIEIAYKAIKNPSVAIKCKEWNKWEDEEKFIKYDAFQDVWINNQNANISPSFNTGTWVECIEPKKKKLDQVIKYSKYKYKGNIYIVTGFCTMKDQTSRIWLRAIIYKKVNDLNFVYARDVEDFRDKFEEVNINE